MKNIFVIVILFCLLSPQTVLAKENIIGNIKNLTGDVKVVRNNKEFIPILGGELFNDDTIKTGHIGTVGIILRDNTIFSLGNESELKLDMFHFDPPNKSFSLVTHMLKGTFIFISGLIGKISPESVELLTPDGSITVRGTKLAIQVKED